MDPLFSPPEFSIAQDLTQADWYMYVFKASPQRWPPLSFRWHKGLCALSALEGRCGLAHGQDVR